MKAKNAFSITGGLGNQFFQLAAGLFLQESKSFFIETSLGKPRRNSIGEAELLSYLLPDRVKTLESRKFRWLTAKAVGYRLRMGIYPRFYEKVRILRRLLEFASDVILSFKMHRFYRIVAAEGLGFASIKVAGNNNFVIGYFQSYKWASEPRVLEELKQLKLRTQTSEIADYEKLAAIEKPLIVHIRLGDYKDQNSFGMPGAKYYEFAMNKLWGSGEYNKIWIFSDEPELASRKLPADLSENFRWVNDIANSASATLEVMRMGYGYVIANSSFSWWGAFLSRNADVSVICPSPWFVGETSPIELIPPNWEQIPISIEQ
jgi:hypothetical protein